MATRPRFRRPRRRPPRARAKLRLEGFTAAELAAKVGISARTVRYYTAQRVLPSPQFRGAATRYLREHLMHLAAIVALRSRRYSLDAIRHALAPMGSAQVEQLAASVLPELAKVPPALALLGSTVSAPTSTTWQDTWHRLLLLPGLELHVHAAASMAVRSFAQEVAANARDRD